MKLNRNNMIIIVLLLVVALTLGYTWATGDDDSIDTNDIQESDQLIPAPDFELTDLDGNSVRLSDFKGKYVFLNFFATWCGPCKEEMPDMELIHEKYKDDVVILAVNLGDSPGTVADFVDEYGLTFKILLDEEQQVGSQYQVSGIPTSYFIDTEGNFIAGHMGTLTYEAMEETIQNMMKE